MDAWITSALTIVGSAFVSFIVSRITYHKQKETDHIFEYKKHILEKRIKVYDEIEIVLAGITTQTTIVRSNGKGGYETPLWAPGFIQNASPQEMNKFITQTLGVLKQGYWMGDEIYKTIQKLNIVLLELHRDIVEERQPITPFEMIHNKRQEFLAFAEKLAEQYFHDICILDNIDDFKKQKERFKSNGLLLIK